MSPTSGTPSWLTHLVPWLAGCCWALFAATRWSLAVTAAPDGQAAVLWIWPPWWQLAILALAAWGLQILAWLWQRRWLARQGLELANAMRMADLAWWPSLALLLVPLIELAWPLYSLNLAPLALAREAWPLAALAVAGAVYMQTRLAPPELLGLPRPVQRRWLPVLIFVFMLAGFALVGLRLDAARQELGPFMGGDEPQYLFMTHSLAVDHDLDLTDNILLRESSHFLRPSKSIEGHSQLSPGRTLVSNHRPGLPALLAPFYAWGLYTGKDLWLVCSILTWLLGAWMVLEVFLLARFYTGRDGPSLLAAAAAGLALPGLIYSNLFFPEMAAAAFMVAAFRRLAQGKRGRWGGIFLAGLLCAYLPWLNERFVLPALLLILYFLVRGLWRRLRSLAAFGLPVLVSAGLLAWYFQTLYGTPYPDPGVHAQGHFLNPRGMWEGFSGLLVDAGEGLFTYGAIWLAAMAGLLWLIRRRPAAGLWVIAMTLAVYLPAAVFADWFAGIGPPSRYLVAAVPFMAVGLAAGAAWAPPRYLLFAVLLAGLSLLGSWWVLQNPWTVYGHQVVLDSSLQFPLLEGMLPSYILHPQAASANAGQGVIWMLVALLALVAMQIGGQRFAPLKTLAGLCLAFAVLAGAALWAGQDNFVLMAEARPAQRVVMWQRLSLIPAGGPSWQAGPKPLDLARQLDYHLSPARYARAPAHRPPKDARAVTMPAGVKPGLFLWGQYLSLPPGRYQARLVMTSPQGGPGPLAWVDVTRDSGKVTLARREISGEQMQKALYMDFSLKGWAHKLEFRVGSLGKAPLTVEAMSITRLRQ